MESTLQPRITGSRWNNNTKGGVKTKKRKQKLTDEKQEETKVEDSDTSEGKYSSMDDNYECNDDEVVLTKYEEEVLLKANNAFTSTLLYIDLRFNPRLKNKILRSFKNKKRRQKLF